jgi:CHASE3 domain sensor protein
MSQFVSVNSKSRNEWISKLETSLSDRATDVRGFLLNRKIRREGLIDSSLR